MDGVLIDSELIWQRVRRDYASERGQVWTDADQRDMLGRSALDWSARMCERLHITHLTPAALAQEIIARVEQAFQRRLPLRPGAAEALAALAAQYPLGLASGSPRVLVDCALQVTGLEPYFQSVLSGDDVQRGKPHPEIYTRSLARLGVAPGQAAGIEDAPNGLRALRAAGLWAVAAPSPEFPLAPQDLALAHAHITHLGQLTVALVSALPGHTLPS